VQDPPASFKSPAWVDGQWLWLGRRWVWEPGKWVNLTPTMVYAGPRIYRRTDGQLVWFKGVLKDEGAEDDASEAAPIPSAGAPSAGAPNAAQGEGASP